MSNIPMPEPVAKIGNTFQLLWFGARTITEIAEQTGAKVGDVLITTTQAEAYADAVRREALEEAAQECEARIGTGCPGLNTEEYDQEAQECAQAIRALIQPTE